MNTSKKRHCQTLIRKVTQKNDAFLCVNKNVTKTSNRLIGKANTYETLKSNRIVVAVSEYISFFSILIYT